MKQRMRQIVILGYLFTLSSYAYAASIEDVAFNGFLSQGYFKSSKHDYYKGTQRGTWEFHELGISVSLPIDDDLRVGAQIFSRDLGEIGNNEFVVDWAFLDYNYDNWLGFRAGRIKMPFGLYGKQRDYDAFRTSILLPQSVYLDGIREFVVAFNGVEAYGNIDLGSSGNVDYEILVGVLDVDSLDSDSGLIENVLIILDAQSGELDPNNLPSTNVEDLGFEIRHIEGGSAIWNLPFEGWRIGASILQGKGGVTTFDADFDLNHISVISTEYDLGNLTVAAEVMEIDGDYTFGPLAPYKIEWEGWYLGGSWRFNDRLSAGISYGEHYSNSDDKDGKGYEALNLPDFLAWQKETTLSVSYNLKDSWILKAETRFINGISQSRNKDLTTTPDENWTAHAIKISMSF